MSKLGIGQELWRFTWPNMLHYKVVGVRQYEGTEQYEVECLSCQHGKLCRVLIGRDDYGHLQTINMLNNEEGDDQRHWHTRDDLASAYYTTQAGAQIERLKRAKIKKEERVKNLEESLEAARRELSELQNAYDLQQKSIDKIEAHDDDIERNLESYGEGIANHLATLGTIRVTAQNNEASE